MKAIILFTTFLFFGLYAQGQNFFEVLGRPAAFENPNDGTSNESDRPIADRTSKKPWFVICDRPDTKVHEKSGRSFDLDASKKLQFGDYYYVVEEEGQYIHLGKAAVNGRKIDKGSFQDFGWVFKNEVLLWAAGLRNERTKINKKAFLLNSVKAIKEVIAQDRKEIVKIYDGPRSSKTIGEKTIYEFYFVLKEENDRYLLSKEVNLSTQLLEVNNPIVGWVVKTRVAEWNTRIAMEPNYQEAAFAERKSNPKFQVIAYGDEEAAENHANGSPRPDLAFWESDPVKLDPAKLAKSNPRRFNGTVVRFPLLNTNPKSYTTGVIGEITVKGSLQELGKINEVNYSALNAALQNIKNVRENFNVVFVIEGTSNLANFRESIAVGIQKINTVLTEVPNVRFGAVVYRDIPEEVDKRLVETKALTSNQEELASWLRLVPFARWRDNDPWTALNLGLEKALFGMGLRKDDTNIIIVLGENGDFSADKLRMAKHAKHAANITEERLSKRLCELNAHLFAVQCKNNGDLAGKKFVEQIHSLALDNANCQYDLVRGVSNYAPQIDVNGPEMTLDLNAQKIALEGGTMRSEINRPRSKASFSENQVNDQMKNAAVEVFQFVDNFWRKLSQIVDEGASYDDVSSGGLSSAAMAKVMDGLKDNSGAGYSLKDIQNLLKDKYKLYAEVFVPKKVEGAVHSSFSQVLFMPKDDLRDYIETLRKLATAYNGDPKTQRDALFNTLLDLLKQYSGDASLKRNTADNTSIEKLNAIMQGLTGEGLELQYGNDKRKEILLSDFRDKKKMKDEDISIFIRGVLERTKTLENILKDTKYEFSYKSSEENIYYWIPLEYTF